MSIFDKVDELIMEAGRDADDPIEMLEMLRIAQENLAEKVALIRSAMSITKLKDFETKENIK